MRGSEEGSEEGSDDLRLHRNINYVIVLSVPLGNLVPYSATSSTHSTGKEPDFQLIVLSHDSQLSVHILL